VGEALTNLYVGLSRERRGEQLSTTRFIQGYAVDYVLGLAKRDAASADADADAFIVERRYELWVLDMAVLLELCGPEE